MHLLSRKTICLCIHILQIKHDEYVKSGVKTYDSKGEETDGPIIAIKRALDDLIRHDAFIVFMESALEDEIIEKYETMKEKDDTK